MAYLTETVSESVKVILSADREDLVIVNVEMLVMLTKFVEVTDSLTKIVRELVMVTEAAETGVIPIEIALTPLYLTMIAVNTADLIENAYFKFGLV